MSDLDQECRELKQQHDEYKRMVDQGEVTDIVDYMDEKGFTIKEKQQFAMFAIAAILAE
jgi:hypothetical protein